MQTSVTITSTPVTQTTTTVTTTTSYPVGTTITYHAPTRVYTSPLRVVTVSSPAKVITVLSPSRTVIRAPLIVSDYVSPIKTKTYHPAKAQEVDTQANQHKDFKEAEDPAKDTEKNDHISDPVALSSE